MAKKARAKKPSALDNLVESTKQDWAHRDTDDIVRQRRILCAEADVLDEAITDAQARLAALRGDRAKINAVMTGLRLVVEKR